MFLLTPVRVASPAVVGLSIWARIDVQRQCSFVTGYPRRPPGFQDHEGIRGRMRAGRRQQVAIGGQTSLPWRLSRSVIDSVSPAGAEFAHPPCRLCRTGGRAGKTVSNSQNIQFGARDALNAAEQAVRRPTCELCELVGLQAADDGSMRSLTSGFRLAMARA